jgi:hypothetical protein
MALACSRRQKLPDDRSPDGRFRVPAVAGGVPLALSRVANPGNGIGIAVGLTVLFIPYMAGAVALFRLLLRRR